MRGKHCLYLFENFSSITDDEKLAHRLRLFISELETRKT